MIDLELARPARRVVEEPEAVEPGEEVLVVIDPGAADLGRALASASRTAGAAAVLRVMPRRTATARSRRRQSPPRCAGPTSCSRPTSTR